MSCVKATQKQGRGKAQNMSKQQQNRLLTTTWEEMKMDRQFWGEDCRALFDWLWILQFRN